MLCCINFVGIKRLYVQIEIKDKSDFKTSSFVKLFQLFKIRILYGFC